MTENYAASVKQRLLNIARKNKEDFNQILIRYCLERLLYRVGVSDYSQDLILKGAMLFHVWMGSPHRSTKDIDMLHFGSPDVGRLIKTFKEICSVEVKEDGLQFILDAIKGAPIREQALYDGIRLVIPVSLGKARLNLQVDIGFGDSISPSSEEVDYPTLLKMPSPHLRIYPKEVVVAEKLHAAVDLDMANSRMKDFYDIWFLLKTFNFEGIRLGKAIRSTFAIRDTKIIADPTCFTSEFYKNREKEIQWRSFLRKANVSNQEMLLESVILEIKAFLTPLLESVILGEPIKKRWNAQNVVWDIE
jgi:predicted nucleotidyltransferase component of viral defense system